MLHLCVCQSRHNIIHIVIELCQSCVQVCVHVSMYHYCNACSTCDILQSEVLGTQATTKKHTLQDTMHVRPLMHKSSMPLGAWPDTKAATRVCNDVVKKETG